MPRHRLPCPLSAYDLFRESEKTLSTKRIGVMAEESMKQRSLY
ncbi:hypothetical protein [Porphyromonas pogonae]|nr:hypothetical protein [Porphyromonas pogonae]